MRSKVLLERPNILIFNDGHTAKRTTETVVEFVPVEHRLNSVGLFGWLLVLFFVTSDDVWMLSEAVKALQQCLC